MVRHPQQRQRRQRRRRGHLHLRGSLAWPPARPGRTTAALSSHWAAVRWPRPRRRSPPAAAAAWPVGRPSHCALGAPTCMVRRLSSLAWVAEACPRRTHAVHRGAREKCSPGRSTVLRPRLWAAPPLRRFHLRCQIRLRPRPWLAQECTNSPEGGRTRAAKGAPHRGAPPPLSRSRRDAHHLRRARRAALRWTTAPPPPPLFICGCGLVRQNRNHIVCLPFSLMRRGRTTPQY